MIQLDGMDNKSRLGANAILSISLAAARAVSAARQIPLYQYLAERYSVDGPLSVPLPMVNMIRGGLHAGKQLEIQDFLIIPAGARTYSDALEMTHYIYEAVRTQLIRKGYEGWLIADEGGFGPHLRSNEEALTFWAKRLFPAGTNSGRRFLLPLTLRLPTFIKRERAADGGRLDSQQMVALFERWVRDYPIISIEDGWAEEDWTGWAEFTRRLGSRIQLIGDDLFTTNTLRMEKRIQMQAGNAVLIKMNQIGTLTETVEAVKLAKNCGDQIKIGSLARSSRLAKYNQLIRINEELGGSFAGNLSLQRYLTG